jgi:hypothetical protein
LEKCAKNETKRFLKFKNQAKTPLAKPQKKILISKSG